MDEATSTKPPLYSTVIKHDRRLRDYPMPDCPIPSGSVGLIRSFLPDSVLLYRQGRGATPYRNGSARGRHSVVLDRCNAGVR